MRAFDEDFLPALEGRVGMLALACASGAVSGITGLAQAYRNRYDK
jgi:thiamine pyrophosphate-dependent acetolactate synthase large subunit-like protein